MARELYKPYIFREIHELVKYQNTDSIKNTQVRVIGVLKNGFLEELGFPKNSNVEYSKTKVKIDFDCVTKLPFNGTLIEAFGNFNFTDDSKEPILFVNFWKELQGEEVALQISEQYRTQRTFTKYLE